MIDLLPDLINMGGYAEDDNEEPERRGFMFRGTDLSKAPCMKNSFMYAIGSGMGVGVVYNLALSRNPFKIAYATYTVVLFGYYGVCRYQYRMREAEMKKLKHVMRDHAMMEGTAEAEQWAKDAHINKQTEVRNFRSEASS